MPGQEQPTDRLMVMVRGRVALVRVIGRGSFKVSTTLKDFAAAAIEQGAARVVLDMSACAGMDSTFMGVLAGLSMRLQKVAEGRVVLVNLSLKTRNLLGTLGLDLLVEPHMAEDVPAEYAALLLEDAGLQTAAAPADDRFRTAATMLEAHENLVKISPDNLPKFKDVLEYLREDVRRGHASPGAGGV